MCDVDDDNVHHYIGERLKLEGETKNIREKVGFTKKTANTRATVKSYFFSGKSVAPRR